MTTAFSKVVVTAYHYKINLDPVVILKDKEENESGDDKQFPAEAFALAKIKLRVVESEASDDTNAGGSAITLNPRGCGVSGDNLEVTHLGSGKSLTVSEQSVYSKEKCEIFLEEKLAPGDELELSNLYPFGLTREHTEKKWEGFYYYNPNHFENDDKINNYPLHTQFLFPTFNKDPIQKATFEMSVSRRKNETEGCIAISNSELLESVDAPGISTWTIDRFKETPALPLDQITVMLLGGFQKHTVCGSETGTNGTQINVWTYQGKNSETNDDATRKEKINRTANEALKLFQFYNGIFNQTAYPLGKIDFVAVPWATSNLSWTTNFGIVANQEEKLFLLDEPNKRTTLNSEIAFQWIGGMVTPPNLPDDQNATEEIALQFNGLLEYVANWSKEVNNSFPTASICANFYRERARLEMLESVLTRQVMQSALADNLLPKLRWSTALLTDFQDAIQQSVETHNKTDLLPRSSDGKTISIREIFSFWKDNGDEARIQVETTESGDKRFAVFENSGGP